MIDFALIVPALPERGGDSLASSRLVTAGGGYNIMSAARRQGVDALYVGQLGVGRFSDIARAILLGEGVELSLAPSGDTDLGVCVVLVDESGERTFVTSPGAELSVQPGDLESVRLEEGDVVYVSGYNVVYPEVAGTVGDWLAALPASIVVAFDPGPRATDIPPRIVNKVLERTDWLFCNSAEARQLVDGSDAAQLARGLFEHGHFKRVVVRDGARGCASADRDGVVSAPGFKTLVVDTNGAGDVHNGVVIAETMMGTHIDEVLLRANAAASIAISSFGPATCPPRRLVDEALETASQRVTRSLY